MKVVINECYGGFGLSETAIQHYAAIKGLTLYPEPGRHAICGPTYWTVPPEQRLVEKDNADWYAMPIEERIAYNTAHNQQTLYDRNIPRDDPALVQTVEELGSKAASGRCAKLAVVEIPDDVAWEIAEYDGMEHVAEIHRVWP